MTSYITNREDLVKLSKGEIQVEDIAKPENIALSTWAGVDLKTMMEIEIDEEIVNDFVRKFERLSCGDCVQSAVDEYGE